jgi:hypothetical protein
LLSTDATDPDAVVSYAGTAPVWPETVNIVLDGVGRAALHRGVAALAPCGRVVGYSASGGTAQVNGLCSQARSIIGFTVAHLRDTHHSATPSIGRTTLAARHRGPGTCRDSRRAAMRIYGNCPVVSRDVWIMHRTGHRDG